LDSSINITSKKRKEKRWTVCNWNYFCRNFFQEIKQRHRISKLSLKLILLYNFMIPIALVQTLVSLDGMKKAAPWSGLPVLHWSFFSSFCQQSWSCRNSMTLRL